jgi:metal-sulfur cluster biosynthetic enzyme
LVEERVPTTVEIITKRLRHVMNPLSGLDVVRTNLIKEISFEDGVVKIVVELPADHQFAAAIRTDIAEKIETLWDVKETIIEFTD